MSKHKTAVNSISHVVTTSNLLFQLLNRNTSLKTQSLDFAI